MRPQQRAQRVEILPRLPTSRSRFVVWAETALIVGFTAFTGDCQEQKHEANYCHSLRLVLLLGNSTLAQDYPKVEVPVFYSYMRFNPENSNIISGFSLNGGGAGVTVNVNHFFGIEAEFAGYQSLSKTFDFPATANSPCPIGCRVYGRRQSVHVQHRTHF